MIFETLSADFGTLQGRTLDLKPGLNIITLPNEGGKSTWTAFLTAMLYGIASGERTTKTSLSTREHYQPWSGAPMAGQIALRWQGRRVLLQRSSTKRQPLGSIQAWDRDTGEPIPELCREDCGQVLLGVERAVFERSALIGQGKLPLTAAPELEQRLTACVTGEEQTGAAQALRRLTDWQRQRCSPRKTGQLDRLRQEADRLAQDLQIQQDLTQQARDLDKQLSEAGIRLEACRREKQVREQWEKARLYQACLEARTQAQDAQSRLRTLTAAAPPQSIDLSELQARLQALEAGMPPVPSSLPEPPYTPIPLRDVPPEEAYELARADASRIERAQRKTAAGWLIPGGIVLAVCGGAALVLGTTLPFRLPDLEANPIALSALLLFAGGAGIVGGLGMLVSGIFQRRRARTARQTAQDLLDRWDARSPEEVCRIARVWQNDWTAYQTRCADCAADSRQRQQWQQALEHLEQELAPIGPARGLEECRELLADAWNRRSAAALARQQAQTAEENWQRLAPLMPEPPQTMPQTAPGRDHTALENELSQARIENQTLSARLTLVNAQRLTPEELEARQQQLSALRQQIAAMEREYQAINLAISALEQAQLSLQARFAPALAAGAGEILSQITQGRYARLALDRSMTTTVQEQGQVLARSCLWLSGGTADQVYLAVRLALCRQLLPPDAPIILDDALVNFDDARLRELLCWLAREAEGRQILLFTCQGREQALWEQLRSAPGGETGVDRTR